MLRGPFDRSVMRCPLLIRSSWIAAWLRTAAVMIYRIVVGTITPVPVIEPGDAERPDFR